MTSITAICGLLGTGKTVLNNDLAYRKHLKGRKILANFKTDYAELVNPLDLAATNRQLNDCDIHLTEAHTFFDSRTPQNKQNLLRSYMFLQSRKMNTNIVYDAQSLGQVDKRLRDITNFKVLAEKTKYGFHYTVIEGYTIVKTFTLSYDDASKTWNHFSSEEIIVPFIIPTEETVDINQIIEFFGECNTKDSFTALVKVNFPNLAQVNINAAYDFLKHDNEERAKEVLLG